MPWVKLDDQFYDSEKVLAAGPQAVALHIAGMCWTAGRLTDGRIPRHVLGPLAAKAGVSTKTVAKLVEVGLWDPEGDGWRIHDWLDWNPSAEQVRADRAAGKERAAKSRRSRAERAANVRGECADPSPSPSVPTERSAGSRNGGTPNPLPAAYRPPVLRAVCTLCDDFGEVYDGATSAPCPNGCTPVRKIGGKR